jgi:hypothetical protein
MSGNGAAAAAGGLEAFLASQANKMPGYTGFRPGVREVVAKTPAMAQAAAASTTAAAATTPAATATLFPALQPAGPQPSARSGQRGPARGAAPCVAPDDDGGDGSAVGDGAAAAAANAATTTTTTTTTTTADDYAPPSAAGARVRSPMRNKELEAAGPGAALRARYASAHARVGGAAAVAAMMSRMRDRLLAKLTGAGDNAFRLRRLFRAYDKGGARGGGLGSGVGVGGNTSTGAAAAAAPPTGLVSLEDFRQMAESFGLQLGDDALLALFHEWDPSGTGSLPYEPLVAALLADGDAFALYAPRRAAAEAAQGAADARGAAEAARAIAGTARGGAAAVRRVLAAMAEEGAPPPAPARALLPWPAFVAGLASVGVALSPQQQAYVRDARQSFVTPRGAKGGGGGTLDGVVVDWRRFCNALDDCDGAA